MAAMSAGPFARMAPAPPCFRRPRHGGHEDRAVQRIVLARLAGHDQRAVRDRLVHFTAPDVMPWMNCVTAGCRRW